MSNKVVLRGGPNNGMTLQCIENLEHRIYVDGNLYYPNGETRGSWKIYVWAPIKPMSGSVRIDD